MAYTEDNAFELIKSAHARGRLGHAFIISGAKNAGMDSLTTRIVNMINAADEPEAEEGGVDLFGEAAVPEPVKVAETLAELEGNLVRIVTPRSKSRIIKVDQMRELEKFMYQAVDADKWKVGVVMAADRMQPSAANAFLKTLEEPPNGCILFLITGSPEALLPTILSRCVSIPLVPMSDERIPLEGEAVMLKSMCRNGKIGFNTVSRALTIKSVFSGIMAQRKADITAKHEATQKEEREHYRNATDGTWLKEREKYFEALIQSDYLLERSEWIDLLIVWLGDLVRIKSGAPRLEFKNLEPVMREVAEKESLESLLRRMESMEQLRGMLNTNVSEALALEVCFMKSFG